MTGAEPFIFGMIGTAFSGYSAYQAGVDAKQQARQQAAFAEYNAKVADQQAEAERMEAIEADRQHRRKANIILSSMRAKIGKSGVTGSPLLVLEDTAEQMQMEREMTLRNNLSKSTAYKNQSILDTMSASAYRKQGSNAYKSGILGATGKAVSGASELGYRRSLLNQGA